MLASLAARSSRLRALTVYRVRVRGRGLTIHVLRRLLGEGLVQC